MSYLLFLDESGHDHKTMPYEVHGGISIHASHVWSFVQEMRALETEAFGVALHEHSTEIKGARLLDKQRFRWAAQEALPLPDVARRHHARAFLQKSQNNQAPDRNEFTAYGQACLKMARGIMPLLQRQGSHLFAVAVPRGAHKAPVTNNPENLRRDWVYLMNRYSLFLQEVGEHGLLVQDHIEVHEDRRFTRQLEHYFTLTRNGREYAQHIVPTPLFVTSDMTYAIQAADVCIYCLNWGFRLPDRGMIAETRSEITADFSQAISDLQWKGKVEQGGTSLRSLQYLFYPKFIF